MLLRSFSSQRARLNASDSSMLKSISRASAFAYFIAESARSIADISPSKPLYYLLYHYMPLGPQAAFHFHAFKSISWRSPSWSNHRPLGLDIFEKNNDTRQAFAPACFTLINTLSEVTAVRGRFISAIILASGMPRQHIFIITLRQFI